MSIIDNHKEKFDKVIEHFRVEIGALKTGRANPAMLDMVRVEAYGALSPINQVASVSMPDARSLVVQPWDKSVLKEIEKAIVESNLNLSPVNDGERIRLNLPALTEETRRDVVKLLNQKAEETKIAVRLERDAVKEEIIEAEKNKDFGEDEKFRLLEDLDKKISGYNEKIKELAEAKEQEIMTI
jgi:ribosome recycling factor